MNNDILYKRLLCRAVAKRSEETVCGFLELDEDKNTWCMCVMVDRDGDYVSEIEDMHTTREYVEIEQDTIVFINDIN